MEHYIKFIDINDKSTQTHPIELSLRLMRRHRNIVQADAARYIGITRNTLSNYERGISEIPFTTFMRLARLYNFKILDFYENVNEQ